VISPHFSPGFCGGGAYGMKNRWIAFLVTLAFSAAALVIGIYRDEIGEVMFNAAML
jgi:hypothetical protein